MNNKQVMTLSTQNLKKKNSKLRIILGIFLGLFILNGCNNETIEEPINTPEINTCDLSSLENSMINTSNILNIYDSNENIVGTIESNKLVSLSNSKDCYMSIKGSDYYLLGDNLEVTGTKKNYEDSLISYSKDLYTNNSFSLYDFHGRLVYTFNVPMTFELYAQKDDYNNSYGVKFANDLLFIKDTDVLKVEDNNKIIEQELANNIPVMMYHFFYDEKAGEKKLDNNWLEINDFKEQLEYLNDNNFISLNMKEIYLYTKGLAQVPNKSYGLTIDDGNESVYRLAYPLLLENNIKATNFVIGGWMGEYMPYEFIEMRMNNVEPQSHSFLMHESGCPNSKGKLICADEETVFQDTLMSLQYVDSGFSYCYPFGHYSEDKFAPMQKAGVRLAFTTEYGKITQGDNLMKLPRIRISADDSIEAYKSKLS